jgi:glycosyltransferase involved in cell wall biosynthesis
MGVIKGTHLIEQSLITLHDEGLIEYRPFSGMAASEMPGLIARADILLDQFRIGSYGVAAVEAMFAGRVVVGHVAEQVRKIILDETGSQLPIVEATPETLELVLREITADASRFQGVAQAGLTFAKKFHDGRYSSSVLEKYWIHPDHKAGSKERTKP